MDRKVKYGLFASLLLWPFLAAAIADCCDRLPSTRHTPLAAPHDSSHNWIGQGASTAFGTALFLLVGIFAGKLLIGRLPFRWVRVYCFVLLLIASLPYIWLLVVLDWRNPHIYRVTCWIFDPIGIWFIPILSFADDIVTMQDYPVRRYVCRSCVECLLILPWMIIWAFISFFFLGGGWI